MPPGNTAKFTCPFCKNDDKSRVIATRPLAREDGVYRRRKCLSCNKRFTTAERISTTAAPYERIRTHR